MGGKSIDTVSQKKEKKILGVMTNRNSPNRCFSHKSEQLVPILDTVAPRIYSKE